MGECRMHLDVDMSVGESAEGMREGEEGEWFANPSSILVRLILRPGLQLPRTAAA